VIALRKKSPTPIIDVDVHTLPLTLLGKTLRKIGDVVPQDVPCGKIVKVGKR